MNTSLNGIARLSHLGVIRAAGEDASTFLHGQLTQDFALLGQSEARLAAFCSAKGRIQASFIGFKRSQEILLVCSRDLLPAALKRLSMFVLRAKVKLSDASDDFQLCGLAGPVPAGMAPLPDAPWSKADAGPVSLVRLYPADGVARAMWVAPTAEALPELDPVDLAVWQLGEVRAGVATVSSALAEAFVPQMLNYESIGGVNFKKGCYPGQEVVARSQFRGVLKRRALLAHCAEDMRPGQEIFRAEEPDQPCATVVQAAATPDGGCDAIVSGQLQALQAGGLHLGSSKGPAVAVRAMPYALLEDI